MAYQSILEAKINSILNQHRLMATFVCGPTVTMLHIGDTKMISTDKFEAGDIYEINDGSGVHLMLNKKIWRAIFEHDVYHRSRLWC